MGGGRGRAGAHRLPDARSDRPAVSAARAWACGWRARSPRWRPRWPKARKGKRAPGGGGGRDAADILRSRFQTTAFFLGSVVTDAAGKATAAARLPDNLTTFRLMAVAVTAGDRYGGGQSSLLVTPPAGGASRAAALPPRGRPVRRRRRGQQPRRRRGARPRSRPRPRAPSSRARAPAPPRSSRAAGREVRFDFQARAERQRHVPVRRHQRPERRRGGARRCRSSRPSIRASYTVAGVLHDTASAELPLPGRHRSRAIDPLSSASAPRRSR